jgi:hypothetical protein
MQTCIRSVSYVHLYRPAYMMRALTRYILVTGLQQTDTESWILLAESLLVTIN